MCQIHTSLVIVLRHLPPGITSGRGNRKIEFQNLPSDGKVHIFSSRGQHVRTLTHSGNMFSGTISWDLKTKENLDIAFGVYYYIVESKIGGKSSGKLAVINNEEGINLFYNHKRSGLLTIKSWKLCCYFLRCWGRSRAIGMGGAFSAIGGDASVLYWNPGAMSELNRSEILISKARLAR